MWSTQLSSTHGTHARFDCRRADRSSGTRAGVRGLASTWQEHMRGPHATVAADTKLRQHLRTTHLTFASPPVQHRLNCPSHLRIIRDRIPHQPLLQTHAQTPRRRLISCERHKLQTHQPADFLIGCLHHRIHAFELLRSHCIVVCSTCLRALQDWAKLRERNEERDSELPQ